MKDAKIMVNCVGVVLYPVKTYCNFLRFISPVVSVGLDLEVCVFPVETDALAVEEEATGRSSAVELVSSFCDSSRSSKMKIIKSNVL